MKGSASFGLTGKLKLEKQQKDVKYCIEKYKALQIITAQ